MNKIDKENRGKLEDIDDKIETFKYLQKILQKEIETIQNNISAYDDLSFKIKGWAITLWAAIIGLGAREMNPIIVGIGNLEILAFWLLDTVFKIFQRRLMFRIGKIEDFLNNRGEYHAKGLKEAFEQSSFGDFPVHDPIGRLTKSQSENLRNNYNMKTSFWRCFRLWNVSLVYLGLSIATLILVFTFAI